MSVTAEDEPFLLAIQFLKWDAMFIDIFLHERASESLAGKIAPFARFLLISLVRCAHSWDIKLNKRREIPYFTSSMYYSVYLYKHANDDLFDDFPKISVHFPKILQKLMVSEHFEEEPMFRLYRNTSKYLIRDFVTVAMLIFSLLKIPCYFHVWNNISTTTHVLSSIYFIVMNRGYVY